MKTLHTEIGKGQQDVVYTELLAFGLNKIKIVIRRDSYDFQSSAVAHVFDTGAQRWNPLAEVHYSKMATPMSIHIRHASPGAELFTQDRNVLLKKVELILGESVQ